jgi:hypothetical protein
VGFLPSVQSNCCKFLSTVELLRMVFLYATVRAIEDVRKAESTEKARCSVEVNVIFTLSSLGYKFLLNVGCTRISVL